MRTVMIIDGNNLLMRCIKAMEYSGLRNGENWQTGPLTAFIGALGRFSREYRPDVLTVCWDAGPSRRRVSLYPEYKAARKQATPDQQERKETAFGMAKAFLSRVGIQQVAVSGYEADDVVAAYWARSLSDNTIIVSGDKDFFQLLDSGTRQLRPDNAGNYKMWTGDEVYREYGCVPADLPKMMALIGDAVDGVPGVRGIGPKKALSGLQSASWALHRVEALQGNSDRLCAAVMSYELVNLRDLTYHPSVPPLHAFAPLRPDNLADCVDLVTFLRSLEMETVLSRFYTNTLWS